MKYMGQDRSLKRNEKRFLEMNENKYTIYKSLWGTMKTVLGGKFISLSANIKKLESLHINTIATYLKDLEKERRNVIQKE